MHLNAYVNRIFAKFTFLDETIEESKRVVFQKEFLTRIIPLVPSKDFAELGRYFGSQVLKPSLEFSGGAANMSDLSKHYFLPMGIYSGWYRAKVVKTPSGRKLVLQHDYGPKWTAFLKEYYSAALKPLIRNEVNIASHDGFVELNFQ